MRRGRPLLSFLSPSEAQPAFQRLAHLALYDYRITSCLMFLAFVGVVFTALIYYLRFFVLAHLDVYHIVGGIGPLLLLYVRAYRQKCGAPAIYTTSDKMWAEYVRQLPSLLRGPRPCLQLAEEDKDIAARKASSCQTSSRRWHLPDTAPVVFLCPGLACDAADLPGIHTILYAVLARGYRCITMERRGQGATLLESARFNVFGDTEDFEAVYHHVCENLLPDPAVPKFCVGISAGSALVVNGMGQFDRRKAAMQGYFLSRNEAVLRAFDAKAYDDAMATKSFEEFMDHAAVFAGYPSGREAYDVGENPVRFLEDIRTPLLCIMAEDDPVSVVSNFTEVKRGSLHDDIKSWPEDAGRTKKWVPKTAAGCTMAEAFGGDRMANPGGAKSAGATKDRIGQEVPGIVCITKSGSHCPMLDGRLCPVRRKTKSLATWSDEAVFDFFDHITKLKRKQK
eukprot:g1720.t1